MFNQQKKLFNFLILGKSRFPAKKFYNIDYWSQTQAVDKTFKSLANLPMLNSDLLLCSKYLLTDLKRWALFDSLSFICHDQCRP